MALMAGSCDAKPLHHFARKVPVFRSLRRGAVDQGKLDHDCLVSIVDKLCKHNEFIMPMHQVLFSAEYAISPSMPGLSDDTWNDEVKTVGKIPRGWMASFLLKRLCTKGLTKDILTGLESSDTSVIPELFFFEVQLPSNATFLADCCSEEHLAHQLLTKRADDVGPRVEGMLGHGAVTAKGVSWKYGCFQLKWQGDRAEEIIHHSGLKVLMKDHLHVVITKAFVMTNNHLDGLATVALAPSNFLLHELFPVDAPFRLKIIKDKKAKLLVDLSKGLMTLENARSQAITDARNLDRNVLKESGVARRSATTAKARAAMEKKKIERGEKRKISFATE
jgi:hypothetical protein